MLNSFQCSDQLTFFSSNYCFWDILSGKVWEKDFLKRGYKITNPAEPMEDEKNEKV
jgi:hypothetical protein